MIIPEKALERFKWAPEHELAFRSCPIAYFGALIPYPKQSAILRDWYDKRPKITVITGWKRVAKTATAAFIGSGWMSGKVDATWPGMKKMGITSTYRHLRKHYQDQKMIIGGKSFEHVHAVLLKEYEELIPKLLVKDWASKTNPRISMMDGRSAIVRTYDQDLGAWKSGKYEIIHLDEEPPYEILMECLERTRTTQGRIIISVAVDDADVSYLPDACKNPLKYFGTDSFCHYQLGVEDVPDELYPVAEKRIVIKQYEGTVYEKAVRYGEFAYTSGRWWPEFDVKVHVIPDFKIPTEWKRFRFIDAGTAAPTACIWAAIHPKNIIFFYREYYKPMTTISERCKDIIDLSGNTRRRDDGLWIEEEIREKYEMTQLDHAEFKRDDHTGDTLDYEYVKEGLSVMPWTTLGQEARRDIIRKWLWVDKKENHFVTHEPGAPRCYFFEGCANLIWEAQKKVFKRAASDRGSTQEKKIQNKDDHAMDCFVAGTLVTTINGDIPIEKIQQGDLVLTRQGYFPVNKCFPSKLKMVITVDFENGVSLTGTPSHKIWTSNSGWKRLDCIESSDSIISCNQLNLMGQFIGDTKIRNIEQTECIIHLGSLIKLKENEGSTRKYGCSTTGKFQKEITSIISTKTHSIIPSKTSNVSLEEGIYPCTGRKKKENGLEFKLIRSGRLLKNGINQTREESGIKSTAEKCGISLEGKALSSYASNAENQLHQYVRVNAGEISATPIALEDIRMDLESWKPDNAVSARFHLTRLKIKTENFADQNAEQSTHTENYAVVYNLNISHVHEYFANGILVKNCVEAACVELRWMVEGRDIV